MSIKEKQMDMMSSMISDLIILGGDKSNGKASH